MGKCFLLVEVTPVSSCSYIHKCSFENMLLFLTMQTLQDCNWSGEFTLLGACQHGLTVIQVIRIMHLLFLWQRIQSTAGNSERSKFVYKASMTLWKLQKCYLFFAALALSMLTCEPKQFMPFFKWDHSLIWLAEQHFTPLFAGPP